jgi:hypothetical protein
LSYRHSSYRKLKKILKDYNLDHSLSLDGLTRTQQSRLIFWALMIEVSN